MARVLCPRFPNTLENRVHGRGVVGILKITPICASCILARRAVEIEGLADGLSGEERLSIFRSILETASLYTGPDIEAALYATMTFRRLKNMLNSEDPYREYKRRVFAEAKERATKIRDSVENIEDSREKLTLLVKSATIATTVFSRSFLHTVFGSPPSFNDIVALQLLVDDSDRFYDYLAEKSKGGEPVTVVYLFGSIAELPYDYLLIDFLRQNFNVYVYGIVRKGAYEDLVAVEDMEWIELEDHVDRVVSLETDTASVVVDETPKQVLDLVKDVDLAIVKNCMNTLTWKNLETGKPWLAMFYAGCPVIARELGVKPGSFNAVFSVE